MKTKRGILGTIVKLPKRKILKATYHKRILAVREIREFIKKLGSK